MTTHEPHRQVPDDEKRLWNLVKMQYLKSDDEDPFIEARRMGDQTVGINNHRISEMLLRWLKEDLLDEEVGGRVMLSEYGKTVDEIESGMTSGESWR